MLRNFGLVKAIVLVFLASACTMVIELVAARILAPYIGVSLYTWTSIIGVVLGGISLGNYVGGRIGDRFTSPRLLSLIFLGGAILSLAILPMTLVVRASPIPTSFHIMSRATIYTIVLFFLPTAVLGMVTPVVIKQTLKDLGRTGNVVGTIYAISCVGSIVGTFLTGFFLIDWFGTKMIVWQISGVLFLMALFSSGLWRSKGTLGLLLTGLVIFPAVFQFRYYFQTASVKESNYYTINVFDTSVQGRDVKALSLDHLIHSYVDLNDPTFRGYDYERIFSGVAGHIARDKADMRFLLIGGGGYSFSRYLEVTYLKASIEVVEIDPAVTEVVYAYLGLPRTSRIITHNRDARIFLIDRPPGSKYDIVFGDAFNDTSVPYHLTTFEFNEMVKAIMRPDGFYVVNLIDNLREGRFVRSFMKTLERSFKEVYLFCPGSSVGDGTSTYVVMATDAGPLTADFLSLVTEAVGPGKFMTLYDLEWAVGRNDSITLSDDHAPVDNMIAPLFAR